MGRNQEKNNEIKDERREQILTAGLRLFASRGLAATKISDIAKAVGVSQGLVYHYFSSKDQIYAALIKHAFDALIEAAEWLEAQPISAADKIEMAIERMMAGLQQNEDTAKYHLLIAVARASDVTPREAKKIIRERSFVPYEIMTRIFRRGQEEGTVRPYDPEELAVVFWTLMKGLAVHKAVHGKAFKAPNVEILKGVFLREK